MRNVVLTTLGHRRADVIGRPLADFYTPTPRAELTKGGYQRALQGHFDTEERSLLTRAGRRVVHWPVTPSRRCWARLRVSSSFR